MKKFYKCKIYSCRLHISLDKFCDAEYSEKCIIGLLEKSEENKRIAEKCVTLQAFNAGISRAYYAAFQRVEYTLEGSQIFNYKAFIVDNQIERDHIPHGKMQQAMTQFVIKSGKKANLGNVNLYDNLYRKRRKADYTDTMFSEPDLNESLREMNIILGMVS